MGVYLFAYNGSAEHFEQGINYQEFLNDIDSKGNFTIYEPGDVVDVVDTIEYVKYWEEQDTTEMWFESTGLGIKRSETLFFQSDISKTYLPGEIVKIHFTIFFNNDTGLEDYDYSKNDLVHVTYIDHKDPEEDKRGIDIFGYNLPLPESLDNNYGRFMYYCFIWIIIGFAVLVIVDQIIKRLTARSKIDHSILGFLKKSIMILVILYGLIVSLSALELSNDMTNLIERIYNIGLFLTLIWLAYKVSNVVLLHFSLGMKEKADKKFQKVMIPVIRKLIALVIFIFAILTLLGYLGIDLTVLALGGVVLSMVIAFAAQDTLSNYFSGMFLIAEPDFKEGDMVMVDNTIYEVRNVGVRNAKLYDVKENMLVLVPNNLLANNKIINLSEPDEKLRLYIKIGVAYGTDLHKVKKILLEIADGNPNVLKKPEELAPLVRFWEFGDSSLNFQLIVWIDDIEKRFEVKNDINFEIDRKFKEESVTIPFPQRDVHIKEK